MRTALRWLLIALGVLAAILLAVTAYGFALPHQHTFSREVSIAAPPERVWSIASNFAAEPKWIPGLQTVQPVADRNGLRTFRVVDEHGMAMTMQVEKEEPPHHLLRRYADDKGSFSGQWYLEIWNESGGSRAKLTETGSYSNPFFRGVARLVLGQDKFVQQYLAALRARAEAR